MSSSLSLVYVTSRHEPEFKWFYDSVRRESDAEIIVISPWMVSIPLTCVKTRYSPPKPTIWQGPHRITNEDWWAKSNALNTAICLVKTEWIAFVDDRCVLAPGWFDCVRQAMRGNYAVCGSYEKHYGVMVDGGVFMGSDTNAGGDTRKYRDHPVPTVSWYGGSGALPLEWCLKVGGFAEDLCDSLGMEDVVFGLNLVRNRLDMRYDARMKIIEDRTPGKIDGALKRADFGISPNDKSHAILDRVRGKATSMNSFNIRDVRAMVQEGEPFPPPSASHKDWYDDADIPTKFNAM